MRCLNKEEIEEAYEANTGHLIVNYFKESGRNPMDVPACLCKNHGPFAWGKDCLLYEPRIQPAPQELQDKHYYRKHGANAYYGQDTK